MVPFILLWCRRRKLVAGFLFVAVLLGLASLAMTGCPSLPGYPRYVWGTEHDLKYGFNTPPGLTTNLRGLISGMVPAAYPGTETGLILFLSAIVLLLMLHATAKSSSDGTEVRRALFALGLVGAILVSCHLYVDDLSLLFLAIVLILELLLSNPQLSKGTKATLQGSIALLFCSPLHLVLTLRYGQLRLLTIVLLVFFAGVLSLISSLRAKTGEAVLPQAWGGR